LDGLDLQDVAVTLESEKEHRAILNLKAAKQVNNPLTRKVVEAKFCSFLKHRREAWVCCEIQFRKSWPNGVVRETRGAAGRLL
jgi:hypothetical protein